MIANSFAVSAEVVRVPIGRLLDNPLNKYLRGDTITPESVEGLRVSIKENGVNVPLLITPYREAFHIVWGHRRRLGAKLAGLTEVPCIIKTLSEDQQFTLMLNENIQRENLSLLSEAACYLKLQEEGASLAAIERKTGTGQPRIKQLLTLLRLEPEVQDYFNRKKLPLGAAAPIAKLTEREAQIYFAREAAKHGWSVSTIERKADHWTPVAASTVERAKKRKTEGRALLLDEDGQRLTKTEALERFRPDEKFSLRDIRRAIAGSCCNECDEQRFPDICRECPVSQMLAILLDAKGLRTQQADADEEVSRAA